MHFLNAFQDFSISHSADKALSAFVPRPRPIFPIDEAAREIARAAVREVLG